MDDQNTHKNQGIQVISRAADILRILGNETTGLSLGQIAKKVNLPRSTVQRIVSALSVEGFIAIEKGYGGIKLGPEIQSLANASTLNLRERIRPLMQNLSDRTGETVDLAILQGNQMLFIDQVVGSHRLRTVSSIGETFPLVTSANGKAALSCIDEDRANQLIAQELERRAEVTTSFEAICAEIDHIRATRLAFDEDEHTDGISAIGYAMASDQGEIFAISVPVPTSRYGRTKAALVRAVEESRRSFERLP